LATIGILLYGVFASYTRSAWLSVFAVLFFAQFFVNGLWKRTLPLFMLCLLLVVLMWDKLPDSSAIMSRALNMDNVAQRLYLLRIAWERFLERPFLGWGSGALNTFSLMQAGAISHNIYLSFLVDGGLVLFLSFFAAVGYLLIRAIRVYGMTDKSSLERNVLVAMTGSILIYLLSGLALELRFFGYFNALFWICASVLDSLGTRAAVREGASRE
jgi:O-antigen ligase